MTEKFTFFRVFAGVFGFFWKKWVQKFELISGGGKI